MSFTIADLKASLSGEEEEKGDVKFAVAVQRMKTLLLFIEGNPVCQPR